MYSKIFNCKKKKKKKKSSNPHMYSKIFNCNVKKKNKKNKNHHMACLLQEWHNSKILLFWVIYIIQKPIV